MPGGQTGPRTDSTVTTLSGNVISATSGIFMQDYWYDTSCTTCLDPHNGIDLHDGRGYHYHVTAQPGPWGHLVPVFPYVLGPTYAGQLQPNATYTPTPGVPSATATTTPVGPPASATPVARPRRRTRRLRLHRARQRPRRGSAAHRDAEWANGDAGGANGRAVPACTTQFNDVDGANPFYPYIQWMACRGYISGYPCGGPGEPCPGAYFRPGNMVTRGQLLKMVVNAAGWAISTPSCRPLPMWRRAIRSTPISRQGPGGGLSVGIRAGGRGSRASRRGTGPTSAPARDHAGAVEQSDRAGAGVSPAVAAGGDVRGCAGGESVLLLCGGGLHGGDRQRVSVRGDRGAVSRSLFPPRQCGDAGAGDEVCDAGVWGAAAVSGA